MLRQLLTFLGSHPPDYQDTVQIYVHCNLNHLLFVSSRWYHGKLDRFVAEKRLQASGRLGSYLVRESDRKVNSYVLSYFGQSGVNHFRITSICGDYYIGGRRFDSLAHLIGYYTAWSDLLKKERLVYPVQPPEVK